MSSTIPSNQITKLSESPLKKKTNFQIPQQPSQILSDNQKAIASVLKSGIMIIEGIKDKERALDFYRNIIVDGLCIPPGAVQN